MEDQVQRLHGFTSARFLSFYGTTVPAYDRDEETRGLYAIFYQSGQGKSYSACLHKALFLAKIDSHRFK